MPRSGGGVVEFALFPVHGQHQQVYNPSVAWRRQLPLHRGAALYPKSLPCVRGGAAQRRWGCEASRISRLRAAPASLQPLSRLAAPAPLTQGSRSLPPERPRLSKSSGISRALPKSLPCVRGGAAQRRWGCEASRISRLRAAPAGFQPLSQPAAASSPYPGEALSTPKASPV